MSTSSFGATATAAATPTAGVAAAASPFRSSGWGPEAINFFSQFVALAFRIVKTAL